MSPGLILVGIITSKLVTESLTKRKTTTNSVKDVGKPYSLFPADLTINWYSHYGNQWKFDKKLKTQLPYALAIALLSIYQKTIYIYI